LLRFCHQVRNRPLKAGKGLTIVHRFAGGGSDLIQPMRWKGANKIGRILVPSLYNQGILNARWLILAEARVIAGALGGAKASPSTTLCRK